METKPEQKTANPQPIVAKPEPQDTEYEREDRGLLDDEAGYARIYE